MADWIIGQSVCSTSSCWIQKIAINYGKGILLNELMPEEEIDGVNVQKLFVDTIKSFLACVLKRNWQ